MSGPFADYDNNWYPRRTQLNSEVNQPETFDCERCCDMGTLYYVDYSEPCPECVNTIPPKPEPPENIIVKDGELHVQQFRWPHSNYYNWDSK